jgi:DNA replication initiation complex subunit (GINS family)
MKETFYYQDLIKAMEAWMDSEDQTIKDAEYMKKEAESPLVKMTMEMLIHDAKKHKIIQQMVIDSLAEEAVHLTPGEFAPLKEVLNRHIMEESESLMRVMSTLDKKEPRITRYLLSYLGADEAGHRELVGKLNELKLTTIQIS